MAKLLTTTCPKCGAHVPVEPGADRATCGYCQTVSILASAPRAPAAAASGGRGLLLPLVVLGVLLGACGVGVAILLLRPSEAPAPAAVSTPAVAAPSFPVAPAPAPALLPAPPPPPPAAPTLSVRAEGPVFVVDVDGDGRSELVAPAALAGSPLYAVFDAHTGAERARTPELPAAELLALAGTTVKRLIVTTGLGQVHAYDVASGAEQWTTALADSALSLCTTREGALHVTTADERRLLLDLTTGRQSETRATCAPALARSYRGEDARDRRDYSAPPGVEAFRCGSARVMGSVSFTVPDACHGKIPGSLEGMVAHRIWRHGAGWLVFGVRAPGRYVPRVAYLERGRVVWSLDVPAMNPLDAEEGGPRDVALAGSTLALLYSTESDDQRWITAFDVSDGRRVFTHPLASCPGHGLAATEDAFVVRCETQLRVLDAAEGGLRSVIGG